MENLQLEQLWLLFGKLVDTGVVLLEDQEDSIERALKEERVDDAVREFREAIRFAVEDGVTSEAEAEEYRRDLPVPTNLVQAGFGQFDSAASD
jgi:hypothetical protein